MVLVTEYRSPPDQDEGDSAGSTAASSRPPPRSGGAAAAAAHVVIRGTAERLMARLMEDNNSSSSDPTFVEDFLLTYRTFLDSPTVIMDQLLRWFGNVSLRDKVTRVLLLWVNNHFTDFETDPAMMERLERFEARLEAEKMQAQLRMLNFACAAKARKRTVTLARYTIVDQERCSSQSRRHRSIAFHRSSREEPLQFSVVGGHEQRRGAAGVFVSR